MSESKFAEEKDLQVLLADHAELLAGGEIDTVSPRRFVLIKREAGVADKEGASDRWRVDHLFIDQDAIPTLVEAKRAANREVRRMIVAQMLDYAANMPVTWRPGRMRAEFEATCEARRDDPIESIVELTGQDEPTEVTVDEFWERAETNLRARKLRLLFVADGIPLELQRIIEFLNDQMSETVVLGIDVGRFVSDGDSTEADRVIVSTVVGNTAAGKTAKRSSGPAAPYEQAAANAGATFETAVQLLDEWAEQQGITPVAKDATRRYPLDGETSSLFRLYPSDRQEIHAQRPERPRGLRLAQGCHRGPRRQRERKGCAADDTGREGCRCLGRHQERCTRPTRGRLAGPVR